MQPRHGHSPPLQLQDCADTDVIIPILLIRPEKRFSSDEQEDRVVNPKCKRSATPGFGVIPSKKELRSVPIASTIFRFTGDAACFRSLGVELVGHEKTNKQIASHNKSVCMPERRSLIQFQYGGFAILSSFLCTWPQLFSTSQLEIATDCADFQIRLFGA